MVGHKNWFYRRSGDVNSRFYNNYCMRFELNDTGMNFIAGTMFCVRSSIFKDFFSKFNPIDIANELELGDVHEPSKTHAWERLYGEIVKNAGYLIKPVEYFQNVDNSILKSYDEEYYLEKYPDVKRVVTNNEFSSGLLHYIRHGMRESRTISKNKERESRTISKNKERHFDEKYYLSKNPDVAAAVKRGEFKSGHEHYLRHGHKEHRKFRF